jgi:NADP-dependent aldehyde dehydrogenase
MQNVLIGGEWIPSNSTGSFQAYAPNTGEIFGEQFPVSSWEDCSIMLDAAAKAAIQMEQATGAQIASFLRAYATNIESVAESLCELAAKETALPVSPRLQDVELPRTTRQLRLAADAAESQVWRNPTVDSESKLASCLGPLGPVLLIGPNNFPLAFNAISGSDFASAIAAGNPVIAKAHPAHPGTTQLLAQQASAALATAGLPAAAVQMFYQVAPEDGLRLVSHSTIAAVGFTGSRNVGLQLKQTADEHGKPIFLEMSSVNPVFFLPSAFQNEDLANELVGSCLLGAGQFCTCPNLFVVLDSPESAQLLGRVAEEFKSRPAGPLLSESGVAGLEAAAKRFAESGAELLAGGKVIENAGFRFENTLFKVNGDQFLQQTDALQTEGFGPMSIGVVAKDAAQMEEIAAAIEGSLTGVVYGNNDDAELPALTRILRRSVGRVIHNKMPTGVAVSPAMNHGGPFPATGHPGFTAVGMPGSIRRFAKLDCYDNVDSKFWPTCLK